MKNALRFRLKQLGLVTAAVAMLTILVVPNSHAADNKEFKGLMVSPVSQNISLKNGQVYTGQMKVSNTTDADMVVNTSVGTYTIKDNNYKTPLYSTSGKYSVMSNWIKLDKTKLTIKAKGSEMVNYVVFTPNNPPSGTQYATIFAETEPVAQGNSGIQATSRVGMVVSAFMADGKTVDKSIIQNEKIAGWQQAPTPVKSSFTIKNEGNISSDVHYQMTVKSAFTGKTIYTSKDETSSVYPETQRAYSQSWDGAGIGFYNVEQKITVNNREHSIKKLVCTVPVWIFLLVLIGVIALVAYFVVAYRMRREIRKTTAKKSARSSARKSTKK